MVRQTANQVGDLGFAHCAALLSDSGHSNVKGAFGWHVLYLCVCVDHCSGK